MLFKQATAFFIVFLRFCMKVTSGTKSYLKTIYALDSEQPTLSFVLVGDLGQSLTKDAVALYRGRKLDLAQMAVHTEFKSDGKSGLFFPLIDEYLVGAMLVPFDYSTSKGVSAAYHRASVIRAAADTILAEAAKRKATHIEILASWVSAEDLTELVAHLYALPGVDELKTTASYGIRRAYILSYVPDAYIAKAKALGEALSFAKRMVLLPPNKKRPTKLAKVIVELFSGYKNVTVDVLDRKALKKLGAGGVLGVGGAGEPVMLRISYTGSKAKGSTAIIGKGVTMDTGGYCIKPGNSQEEMKGDCGGAAAVIGAMLALAGMNAPVSVTAYTPIVENLIDSTAFLTGDVLTMMDGHTVEVGNTDAEGRLILADALTLAQRDGATEIIDLATLTGACVAALGKRYAGLFANNDELANRIALAGEQSGEHFWRLPLAPEYDGEVTGYVADYRNIGKSAGAILAALFLQKFVQEGVSWAHLDIAGPAIDGFDKGKAPAFGVLTLVNLLTSTSCGC
jgi:leucyl aminopeptidase